jgi:hypothetical protein
LADESRIPNFKKDKDNSNIVLQIDVLIDVLLVCVFLSKNETSSVNIHESKRQLMTLYSLKALEMTSMELM